MSASFQPDGIGSVCLCSFPNADKDVTHGLTSKLLSCKFRMQSRASRNWIVEVGPQGWRTARLRLQANTAWSRWVCAELLALSFDTRTSLQSHCRVVMCWLVECTMIWVRFSMQMTVIWLQLLPVVSEHVPVPVLKLFFCFLFFNPPVHHSAEKQELSKIPFF